MGLGSHRQVSTSISNLATYISGEDVHWLLIEFVALYLPPLGCEHPLPDIYHQFGSLNINSLSLETLFLFYPPKVGFGLP